MTTDIKQKIKQLMDLGTNPRLVLFQALESMEQKLDQAIKDATLRAKQGLQGEIEALVEKTFKETFFKNVAQIKGDKGESGEQGEKGEQGEMGEPGIRGLQGITGHPGPKGEQGLKGLSGKDGKDGISPIKGVDYFTDGEVKNFFHQIIAMLNLKKISEEIEEIKKMIEKLEKVQRFGGQKTIHRGGIGLEWETLSLSADGSSATLSTTPYDSNAVMIFYNGILLKSATDYTLSGKSLTFINPQAGSVAWAFYRKS